MHVPVPPSERRTRSQLRRHYEIEKALADRLRSASKDDRPSLYPQVYDELFRRVPELLAAGDDRSAQQYVVGLQAQILSPFLGPDATFLEVGAGDCALTFHLAATARKVFAVDASTEVAIDLERPPNFEMIRSDATALTLDSDSVDLAYSCHFLEHLHPDDALAHAAEVRRVLRPGGSYVCITPNRLWGPHDVSRHFDHVPTGLHLREYTHGELARVFRRAGFERVEVLRGIGRVPRRASIRPYNAVEGVLGLLPARWRRQLMPALLGRFGEVPFRPLEQVKLIANTEA